MPLLAVGVFWGPGFIWQDDHLDDDEDDNRDGDHEDDTDLSLSKQKLLTAQ